MNMTDFLHAEERENMLIIELDSKSYISSYLQITNPDLEIDLDKVDYSNYSKIEQDLNKYLQLRDVRKLLSDYKNYKKLKIKQLENELESHDIQSVEFSELTSNKIAIKYKGKNLNSIIKQFFSPKQMELTSTSSMFDFKDLFFTQINIVQYNISTSNLQLDKSKANFTADIKTSSKSFPIKYEVEISSKKIRKSLRRLFSDPRYPPLA